MTAGVCELYMIDTSFAATENQVNEIFSIAIAGDGKLYEAGKMIVDGVFSRDYAVVQTLTALIAVVVVVANFLVDMVYVVLDPRIRRARALA